MRSFSPRQDGAFYLLDYRRRRTGRAASSRNARFGSLFFLLCGKFRVEEVLHFPDRLSPLFPFCKPTIKQDVGRSFLSDLKAWASILPLPLAPGQGQAALFFSLVEIVGKSLLLVSVGNRSSFPPQRSSRGPPFLLPSLAKNVMDLLFPSYMKNEFSPFFSFSVAYNSGRAG